MERIRHVLLAARITGYLNRASVRKGVQMTAFVQVFGRRDDETDHALKRPATKKRQGTKSRAVGQWLAASAMEIARRRPVSMLRASAAPAGVHDCMQGSPGECNGHLGGHAE